MQIRIDAGEWVVDWCQLGESRFTELAFAENIALAARNAGNAFQRQTTAISALAGLDEEAAGSDPTGFIFHLPQSGGTVLARLLAACPRNVLISDAPPVDALFNAVFANDARLRAHGPACLRGLLRTLSQRRGKLVRYVFIKFCASHAVHLPLIREAFPHVPALFLYRSEPEITASAESDQSVPSPEELARWSEAALADLPGDPLRFAHYEDLPALLETVEGFFGTDYMDGEHRLMRQASRFDARNPNRLFLACAHPSIQHRPKNDGSWYARMETRRHAWLVSHPSAAFDLT